MDISMKTLLGFLFGILSGASLLLNLIALLTVFRLAFVLRKNHVYIIAFFNILSDAIQMTMATFYLAPTIMTSSFLFSDQKRNTWTLALSSTFLFLWYFETITQVIMALNRFAIVCLQKHKLFTFTKTILLFVFLIPFSFALMYKSQYSNPCCAIVFDQEYLSYSYLQIEGIPNYSNELIDLPMNTTSTVVSILCYVMIFWTVHKSAVPTFSSVSGNGDQQKNRKSRDIRYAIQFCFLLISYIFAWVLFRILPLILPNQVEWYITIPTFYTINCASNAIMYLGFNSEVQSNLVPQKLLIVLQFVGLSRKEAATKSTGSWTEQSRGSIGQQVHNRSLGVVQ